MAEHDRAKYRIEALAKGLRVLAMFSERRPALRVSDLVEQTGIPMGSLFRIVATLESEGYLEQLPDGRYRPDSKVLTLGFAALQGLDLVQTATGPLQTLSDNTGETVNLGVLSGDQVLYLVRLRNSELVTANIQVGSTLPAVYASMGKVLLAYLDGGQLDALLRPESFVEGAGPHAVRSRTALDQQLALIRERGYALQDQEVAHGLRSIAAPVRDQSGKVVASVNVAVQAVGYDVERLLNEFKQPLLDTCAEISLRLGHRAGVAL
ncbi:IclR family transcriptional regulator [Streptomyces sp. NPDC057623]|uniref:IclR family transcriptional regulator n=1 Tax=Streptomyces sp. NPDC057623 TaxID=3346187 RepID=UPI0036A4CAFA